MKNQLSLKGLLSSKPKLISFITTFILLGNTIFLSAQNYPPMEWFKEQWPLFDIAAVDPETPLTQDGSGEDWYYDIKPYFDGVDQEGYFACGYSSFVDYDDGSDCLLCLGSIDYTDFETTGHDKGCQKAKLVELDLQGNIEWYNLYSPPTLTGHGAASSTFYNAIQLSGGGYLAVGETTNDGTTGYNAGLGGSGNTICTLSTTVQTILVVKTNSSGGSPQYRTFGIASAANAYLARSVAYDVVEDPETGDIYIVGYARSVSGGVASKSKVIVLKLDSSLSGVWINQYAVETGGTYNATGTSLLWDAARDCLWVTAIEEIASGGSDIYLMKINPDGTQVDLDPSNTSYGGKSFQINNTTDSDINTDGICTNNQLIFDNTENYLLIPVIINKNGPGGVYATNSRGMGRGKIYKYQISANTITDIDVTAADELKAGDLKITITGLSDGGYAVVSSKQNSTPPTSGCYDFTSATGICSPPTDGETYTTDYWETDAYVARYSSSDVKLWDHSYPIVTDDGITTFFPDDIKNAECLFSITTSPTDDIVIVGKTSHNYDDDLIMKLYSDCNVNTTYDINDDDGVTSDNIITASITWNSDKKIRGIITVEDGFTLTITGSTTDIQFADSKAAGHPTYILVKRGGKLVISDGARLTGNLTCGTMWDGIFVEGTHGTNQPNPGTYNSGFGQVIVGGTTKPIIENARIGIKAQSPDVANYPSYDGGIIFVDGGIFYDNATDLYFGEYDKINKSGIRHGEFITNNKLKDEYEVLNAHIYLEQGKGIQIRGNTFENTTTTTVYPTAERGYGILGLICTYTCDDNPNTVGGIGATGSDPNTFTELYYGINSTQAAPGATNLIIKKNSFTDNYNGVYVGGTTVLQCNLNTFNVNSSGNYGLYLDASSGFQVEENTFNGPGQTPDTWGVILNGCGTANKELRRNFFNDFKYAAQSQGTNGSGSNGLVFKCNTFSGDKYDISIASGAVNNTQGNCVDASTPAGNSFSSPAVTAAQGQFFVNSTASALTYNHHTSWAPTKYTTSKITLNDCGVLFNGTTSCPQQAFLTGEENETYRVANNNLKNYFQLQNENNAKLEDEGDSVYTSYINDILRSDIVSYYMENGWTDSIQIFLAEDNSMFAQTILAAIAIDEGNYYDANTHISNIENETTAEEQGFSDDIPEIKLALISDTLNWFSVTEEQFNTIETLATGETSEGISAKLILELLLNQNYEEPILNIEEVEELYDEKLIFNPDNILKIYPDPLKNSGVVEIHLSELNTDSKFIISDINGRKIKEYDLTSRDMLIQLNGVEYTPGIYIGTVIDISGFISRKFLIIR